MVATGNSYSQGHSLETSDKVGQREFQRSDPAIPTIGAHESLSRTRSRGPKGSLATRGARPRRRTRRASGSGAGGMATSCPWRATADLYGEKTVWSGRGDPVRADADVARRA